MAADLRAGARRDVRGEWTAVPEVAQRVSAAVALADETGAPLADVLDRLEADLRAGARARTAALAQAAGAKASAVLLAVLPVAGLAIGFAIGADPLAVLLRTPLGAACLVGAVLLQLAGLGWSAWLVRIGTLT
jgi:tight adherence protein B